MINIDNNKLSEKYNKVKSYLEYYEKYGAPLVAEYSKELDDKVSIDYFKKDQRQY